MTATVNRVLIAAGGTGGHIFPALAVANVLHEAHVDVQWLGAKGGMEQRLVPGKYPTHCMQVKGIRNKGKLTKLFAPFMIARALWQAIRVIRQVKPSYVICMGGFVAGPAGIAAWLMRVPLIVHEQNSVAGVTNRILARFASKVFQAFPHVFPSKIHTETIGNPLRQSITAIPAPSERLKTRDGQCHVLILGGSLGAHVLNMVVPKAMALLNNQDNINIWQQTGSQDVQQVKQAYHDAGISARVDAFIDDMAAAYAWADLIICRAGALTVSEIMAVGLAAVFVPLPHAVDNHQYHNARYLEEAHAALIIPQAKLTPAALAKTLNPLLSNRSQLLSMARQAHLLAKPNAAQQLVEQL